MAAPSSMEYLPIPLGDLEVGQQFTGTMTCITDFRAVLDIGSVRDVLVHISASSRGPVHCVHDFLVLGQHVDVWVQSFCGDGKFNLTMIEDAFDAGGRTALRHSPASGSSSTPTAAGAPAAAARSPATASSTLTGPRPTSAGRRPGHSEAEAAAWEGLVVGCLAKCLALVDELAEELEGDTAAVGAIVLDTVVGRIPHLDAQLRCALAAAVLRRAGGHWGRPPG